MEVIPTIELTGAQLRIVRELLYKHLPGTTVWAYGSRVMGTARRNSDLDLVVLTSPNLRAKVADLQESFEERPAFPDRSSRLGRGPDRVPEAKQQSKSVACGKGKLGGAAIVL